MNFFKKNSKKNVELVGGDMDGIITAVQETLPELEFESLVYPSGQDLSGNLNETKIKDIVNKTKPIKTIKIIYKKWKSKGNRILYRFDRYEKG
ncbi:MAG: hypothetical protein JYX80_14785 [Candidatus Scalindua sediminis]|nr:hypothetical protein [Candidatus Scalindua sediminis]HDY66507.1 hypothetical protein [Candidatus Scalindua sp.]